MSQHDKKDTQESLASRRAADVPETALILHSTEWSVRELIRKRKLRSVRIGRLIRVPMDAIDDFLAGDASIEASAPRKRRTA